MRPVGRGGARRRRRRVLGERLDRLGELTPDLEHGVGDLALDLDVVRVGLFPRVGFFNRRVTEFLRNLVFAPEVSSKPVPPTLSWTLGYLMPAPLQTEWIIEPQKERMLEGVTSAIKAIAEYGMPAMTRYPDVKALLRWAENPLKDPHAGFFQRDLLKAVIYCLNEKRESALHIVEKNVAEGKATSELSDPGYAPYLRLKSLLGHRV